MYGNYSETKTNLSEGSSCVAHPVTLATQIGLTIAYFIVFCLALLGNSVVIFVVHRHPKLRSTFNMLIVNMAASDILDALTAVPLSVTYLFQGVKWFSGAVGVFLCKFLPFLAYLSMGSSVLTLTVMTFDRYLAVVHTMKRPLSPRITVVAICMTWLISGAVFASELHKYTVVNLHDHVFCITRWVEDLEVSQRMTMYEMVTRFVVLYMVPLLAMALLYSKIVLHMWNRRAPGEHIDKNQRHIEKQKRKVVTMLVTIVTLFAICWLPAHVNHFMYTFDLPSFRCLPTSLVFTLYFWTHVNTAINPYLYLVFNESFREGFRHQVYNRLSTRKYSGRERLSSSKFEAFSATTSHTSILPNKQGSRRGTVTFDTQL
ncbi:substance-P receptor-like [Montipora capricornis]|uniref:substance-P receptor-like n=1 Tax=Montipora capricornis TaxID=246305 RepID=UPI0035F15CDA